MIRIAKGDIVRCQRTGNDPVMGKVVLASTTNPQSVAIRLYEDTAMPYAGGLVISGILTLTVDYEQETVTDLFGNNFEIEIEDHRH